MSSVNDDSAGNLNEITRVSRGMPNRDRSALKPQLNAAECAVFKSAGKTRRRRGPGPARRSNAARRLENCAIGRVAASPNG